MDLNRGWVTWTGRVLSGLVVLLLVFSATMKLTNQPEVVEMMGGKFGFPEGVHFGIGIVEVLCLVLYAVPRTSVLGAVLITGYLGGAIVTHLRVGDPYISPILIGVIAWAGLYLRDHRLRSLMPLVRPADPK